jgi:hypothetical protein
MARGFDSPCFFFVAAGTGRKQAEYECHPSERPPPTAHRGKHRRSPLDVSAVSKLRPGMSKGRASRFAANSAEGTKARGGSARRIGVLDRRKGLRYGDSEALMNLTPAYHGERKATRIDLSRGIDTVIALRNTGKM